MRALCDVFEIFETITRVVRVSKISHLKLKLWLLSAAIKELSYLFEKRILGGIVGNLF
jgi:hypothetical protein